MNHKLYYLFLFNKILFILSDMHASRQISIWLFIVCGFIFAMTMIGAITRLSESGLSIVEWKPITGTLPPLNDAAWQHVFAQYQTSPEFKTQHSWMQLDDFKKIFFWEWFHRFWGRMIGLVFGLPLLYFAITKKIPNGYGRKFISLLVLGGIQGFIGWFMVKSGLVDRPSVSHFRLAMHLSMALILYSLCLIFALQLWPLKRAVRTPSLQRHGWLCLMMIALTLIWGAFVAGLDAGMIYNEFPHMGAGFIPDDFSKTIDPWWIDAVKNNACVQFIHRWLAMTSAIIIFSWSARLLWQGVITAGLLIMGMIFVQIILGISTLLSQVHIVLATLHQAGGVLLLSFILYGILEIRGHFQKV
jgi:cytochrome c oxidase assembly protein subunit 15